MKHRKLALSLAVGIGTLVSSGAWALEYPIGEPQLDGNMEVAAVYLQPIKMDPPGMMQPADKTDIHLEADIHALADNPNGFGEGEWVPYLDVSFALTKINSGEKISGTLMPMVASDGPHYGDNVKLLGMGEYTLTFTVSPPGAHFGRHTDKETGVNPWFTPFTTQYTFTYAGTGKKGAY
mgnify:CR=1 FL=1